MSSKEKVGSREFARIDTILYFDLCRWYRALNALKAMHTMVKLTFPETVPGEEKFILGCFQVVRVKLKQENHQVWKVDIDLFIVSVCQKLKS